MRRIVRWGEERGVGRRRVVRWERERGWEERWVSGMRR